MSEILIAGGGLAGGLAALRLARAGREVTLIERSAGPHHKVCGEFLSGEALAELEAVGLDPAALGAAPLTQVRLAGTGRTAEAALPFRALSLTRRALDEALLAMVAEAGAEVRRGVGVAGVEGGEGGWRLRLTGDETVSARTFLAATGKHDLRGRARPPGTHDDLVGLKAYYRPAPDAARALGASVELIFFPGGYCGVQPVEGGLVNACLVVSQARLSALGGPWAVFGAMIADCPRAALLLGGAERMTQKPLAVAKVPYGYVRTRTNGPYHLGDQAAVIPSFCGEGMGLALRSGRLAAEAVLAGESAAAFQRRFARLAYIRVKSTAFLSRALAVPVLRGAALGVALRAPGLLTTLAAATRTPDGRAQPPAVSSA